MSRHHQKILLVAISAIGLLGLAQHSTAANSTPDKIEDLLQERWFEVEVIIFERLNVLDFNTTEELTQTRPRHWPANLREMRSLGDRSSAEIQAELETTGLNPLLETSPFCYGYPLLAQEDPLHPLFLPEEAEFSDEVPGEEERLDEIVLSELDELPQIEDEATADLDQDIPNNAPQLSLTPYLQLLADVAEYEDLLRARSYTWLDTLTMTQDVKAINRQSHLRPILHRRWLAPVPERNDPQPIYLASDVDPSAPLTLSGQAKIEGFVTVTVGRYLHFAPTLWYHADNLGLAPVDLPLPELAAAGEMNYQSAMPTALRYMELTESRRMRSGDLHYLDHPKFGVIVRIDTIETPKELESALLIQREQ